jgi:hypothetical protein
MFLLGLEYPQVVPPVVRLVSVFMVDHLSWNQLATELPLGNMTVHRCSRVSKPLVALLVLEPSYHRQIPS